MRFMSGSTDVGKGSTDSCGAQFRARLLQAVRSVGRSSTGLLDSRTILAVRAPRKRSKISTRSRAISRVRTSPKGGTS